MMALSKNRRGPDVERWQRFLVDQKLLMASPTATDGIFGEKTDLATREFQKREGLEVDGVVGEQTLLKAQARGFAGSRRVRQEEVTKELTEFAKRLIKEHWRDPFGTEFPFESGGKRYFGRIEQHYHPPGGPLKPWGYHSGVSLFVETAPGPTEPVHQEAVEHA